MHELTIENAQKIWRIKRPANLEELWNTLGEEDFGDDERLPYWVEIWPASLALAKWLVEQRTTLQGLICLDVGCGLGFTSLVGASLGARIIGMDYEQEALMYAHENALLNEIEEEPIWVVADWRYPAFAKASFPLMWAGDIVYEQRFIKPVTRFINHCLHPQGRMWIAEPNRTIYQDFVHRCQHDGLSCQKLRQTPTTAFEGHEVTVNIWEVRKYPTGSLK